MTGNEIRKKFLDFFEARGHKILPGSSLVPDDPTLLLTTAGMVQFKPIFEGRRPADYPRVATCQRCVRTTDIEEVGKTARHLTFFEMLGNFSFGDYYKEEIIPWSWEFLTGDLGLDPGRLWVSVFTDDDEAHGIWVDKVGLDKERVVRLGEADNFWAAGPTGPCGPCTEILYDLGEEAGCGRPECGVGCDCDRFLELWNLVFMQYNRDDDGAQTELKTKGVDTGLGLERAASILQGVPTNFDTDRLRPVIAKVEGLSTVSYGQDDEKDVSLKIVADHTRAITFLVSDGVIPSNEGRGYVLRRLIRRAVRHGRRLSIDTVFVPEVVEAVIEVMRGDYPEIKENRSFIIQIIRSEEERFTETLRSGLAILEEVMDEARAAGKGTVGGDVVFKLYDTYGFPPEVTSEICEERGLKADIAGFEREMAQAREAARRSWKESHDGDSPAYADIVAVEPSRFIGHDQMSSEAKVVALVRDGREEEQAPEGSDVEVVLEQSPFYAEKGGQVGDAGTISWSGGSVEVADTQNPVHGLIVHRGRVREGLLKKGQAVTAEVDVARRRLIERNHTATHLVHWALREVLGDHVRQAGSFVGPDRFRFDFTHYQAVAADELEEIERLVNLRIADDEAVRGETKSLTEAKREGALAFFGDKYEDQVRVLVIGDFSRELCGGTHVENTAAIQVVKIVSESSVGANLRRIEGVTSSEALNLIRVEEKVLGRAASLLGVDTGVVDQAVSSLIESQKDKDRQIEKLKVAQASDQASAIFETAREVGRFKLVQSLVDEADAGFLRSLVDSLKDKVGEGVVIVGTDAGGKALVVAGVTKALAANGVEAGKILKVVAPIIGGGGGGRAELAQAGGPRADRLPEALEAGTDFAEEMLKDGGR